MFDRRNELVFNSIAELVDALDNSERLPDAEYESNKGGSWGWCDTNTYDEARMYLETGRLYDQLGADIDKYRTKGTETKRTSHLSVVGHNVVVPLYLQGVPNNMINKKTVINNKIVTIFYNPVANGGVDQEDMINGAVKLFKNIISLEEQGYRVNLYVLDLCKGRRNDEPFGYCVKLKSDRETLNIKKLCFPLVSSSYLRRIGFKVRENLYKDWIGNGYGWAVFDSKDHRRFIRQHLGIHNYEVWTYKGKKLDSKDVEQM